MADETGGFWTDTSAIDPYAYEPASYDPYAGGYDPGGTNYNIGGGSTGGTDVLFSAPYDPAISQSDWGIIPTASSPVPAVTTPAVQSSSKESSAGYTTGYSGAVGNYGALKPMNPVPVSTANQATVSPSIYSYTTTAPAISTSNTWGETTTTPGTQTTTNTSTGTTSKTPTMALPEYKSTAALSLPARDAARERFLQQEEAALGIGEWRQSIRSGLNKLMSEGNFASRGAQMRQMFAGAGAALGKILQSASSAARQQYNAEYQDIVTSAIENYHGQLSENLSQYQAAVNMYLGTMDTTTTTAGEQITENTGGVTKQTGGTTGTTTGGEVFNYKGTTPYNQALGKTSGQTDYSRMYQ